MDGFHLTKAQLELTPDPAYAFARRGAPFTFDAQGLVDTLSRLKSEGKGTVPGFSEKSSI
jgi:pantothenate kinase